MPEMAAAFGVARLGGILVAAGPSLTAAETIEEFTDVSAGIADTHTDFEEQLALLEKDGQDKRFEGIRADAGTLIHNLESIEEGMLEALRVGRSRRRPPFRACHHTLRPGRDSGSRPG